MEAKAFQLTKDVPISWQSFDSFACNSAQKPNNKCDVRQTFTYLCFFYNFPQGRHTLTQTLIFTMWICQYEKICLIN